MAQNEDHRRFPRAKERIAVRLWRDDGKHEFKATVYTGDVSVTGAFFTSEFYLRPGFELNLEFSMPNDERLVRVKGVVVREVRLGERTSTRARVEAGFAIRFTEYTADAKTVLASSFLSAELDEFVAGYLERRTAKAPSEIEQLRDVLVAWEVGKMELKGGELDIIRDRIRVDDQGHIRRRTTKVPTR